MVTYIKNNYFRAKQIKMKTSCVRKENWKKLKGKTSIPGKRSLWKSNNWSTIASILSEIFFYYFKVCLKIKILDLARGRPRASTRKATFCTGDSNCDCVSFLIGNIILEFHFFQKIFILMRFLGSAVTSRFLPTIFSLFFLEFQGNTTSERRIDALLHFQRDWKDGLKKKISLHDYSAFPLFSSLS